MMRYDKMSSFRVMDLVREANRYEDTIHFEVGQPDLNPPAGVVEALSDIVKEGLFGYTESMGLPALREKISMHYRRVYGVEVDPSRILITPGSSIAFMVAYQLTTVCGSKIGLADPSYPCYRNFAYMVDSEPLFIDIDESNGFVINPSSLEGLDLDLLHISTPSNPTGTVYGDGELEALARYCEEKGISLISDELYHGLVYGENPSTVLSYSDEAIVINGFSKYFCMPGLRLGWMIVPERLVRASEIVAQNLYISAPSHAQYAAVEAFDYDYLSQVREEFRARRDFLLAELSEIFHISAEPQGAFYIWCDASRYTDDAVRFSFELLAEKHVAVTPGADFGSHMTDTALRFSFTRDIEHMREGIERIKSLLGV
jgi:aspartate/methionine/tyrosine aminotransferase